MDRIGPSTRRRAVERDGPLPDLDRDARNAERIPSSLPSASNDPSPVQSARAYDLLLPDRVTAVASIRVTGEPVLAPLQRDDVVMMSCRLIGEGVRPTARGSADGAPAMTSDGRTLPYAPASLDCVILHRTLDHWADARGLLRAVATVLKPDGIVALTGANRLDINHLLRRDAPRDDDPIGSATLRRTLWGYRRILRQSGLHPDTSYFVVEDAAGVPRKIVSTSRAPATAFFGLELSSAEGAKRLLLRGLNTANLLPCLEGQFLILAHK